MRKTGIVALLTIAGVFLALGGARAQNRLSAMDRMFLMKAAQGGMAEVMLSQLALKRSHSDKVQDIARMLIRDHSAANHDLRKVAKDIGYHLPAKTDAAHQALYQKLSRMSGSAFNRAYMLGQVRDHNAAVALFKKELDNGEHSNVRGVAAKYLPAIQTHTAMIYAVASNVGVKTMAAR